jgi:hypothetical protein
VGSYPSSTSIVPYNLLSTGTDKLSTGIDIQYSYPLSDGYLICGSSGFNTLS